MSARIDATTPRLRLLILRHAVDERRLMRHAGAAATRVCRHQRAEAWRTLLPPPRHMLPSANNFEICFAICRALR